MTLDGVGGCTTLVKADIHRMGAVFPHWPVDHQLETEGFAQLAKKLGARLIGLTDVFVWHGSSSLSLSLSRPMLVLILPIRRSLRLVLLA